MQTLSQDDFRKKYGDAALAQLNNVKVNSSQSTQQPTEQPGLLSRISSDLQTRGANTNQAFNSDQGFFSKALQLTGQGAGFAGDILTEGLKSASNASGLTDNVIKPTLEAVKPTALDILHTPVGQLGLQAVKGGLDTYNAFKQAHPEAAGNLEAVVNIASILPPAKAAEVGTSALTTGAGIVKSSLKDVTGKVANTSGDNLLKEASSLRKDIQLSIAKKNVNPQFESSATRLTEKSVPTPGVAGTAKTLPDPVQSYDKYLQQSKKALTDIHADPAISQVGSDIGDAFNKVVRGRRAVGSTIGNELKVVGKERIPIVSAKDKLLSELKDSGLSLNPKTNKLTSFQGSKFVPQETKMLQGFVDGINKLGPNPSVAAVDNFIAKTRTDLKFAQGASGVMGTTNAERIVNGGLANLRETLNPAVNGKTSLAKYWKANESYSKLSDFVGEGEKYLGKVTQSGDFSKDASLAKSSVQSILNNGKKDWLIKLEGLTGYPALDHSVLALQAMKDAGDFRGLSLLQTLSEGAIPTTKAGFTQKAIDYAMQKGGKALAGTPEEQTRAFLNALKAGNQ